MSKTFAMIKPDIVGKVRVGIGGIINHLTVEGFKISEMRMVHMTKEQAEGFYAEHKGKPFFDNLCDFMTSDSTIVMVLERSDAVAHWRKVIGSTNPAEADDNTIRQSWGTSIDRNAVHGSDSEESAAREINYFFG